MREILELNQMIGQGDKKNAKQKFWDIVGKVKRGKVKLSDNDIMELSKIRDMLFENKIILSPRKGSVIFITGFLISLAIFLFANLLPNTYTKLTGFFLYLSLIILEQPVIYFGFLTGRILGSKVSGIGIDGFYKYTPFEFGVKMNYIDYLKVPQTKRVLLYGTTLCFQGIAMVSLIIIVYFGNIKESMAVIIPVGFFLLWVAGAVVAQQKLRTGELYRFLRELKIKNQISC